MKPCLRLLTSLSSISLVIAFSFFISQAGYAASFPCTTSTLILSAQNGPAGSPSTWAGGTVPSDGNCVVIRHHVTLNRNLGTEGGTGMGWIRIENGGTLDSDCASPHAIHFGSTGTDPVGSGSSANPGANASMFGMFVSYGTVNLSCSAPNNVTVTSANEESPWYIHHVYGDYVGCTAISNNVCSGSAAGHGAVLNLQNAVLSHLGSTALYFSGIDWDMTAGLNPTNTLNISSNHITDLFEIVADGSNLQSGNFLVARNWFDAPWPDPSEGIVYFFGGVPNNWQIIDNTITGAQTVSFLVAAPSGSSHLQVLRNAILGSPTIPFGIAAINAGTANSIQTNLCVNPEPPAPATIPCIYIAGSSGDTSTMVSFNIIQGGHSGISQIGEQPTFSPTFSFNWISQWNEDFGAQGAIITRSGVVNEMYNVLLTENTGEPYYMIGDLAYSDTSGACGAVVHQDHNTIYGISNPDGYSNINFGWGDNSTNPHTCVVNSYARSNISYGGNIGYYNNNGDDTWNLSQGIAYGGAAVHHNLDYGATTMPYWNIQTSPGFDNGVVPHPSYRQYRDLSVDPRFLNPNRRPNQWDSVCGGPGTNDSLFQNLARRSGFGGIFNSCYSIPALWSWIRLGFAPLNMQLIGAGHDGTWIGAVAPVGNHP